MVPSSRGSGRGSGWGGGWNRPERACRGAGESSDVDSHLGSHLGMRHLHLADQTVTVAEDFADELRSSLWNSRIIT